MPTLELFTAAAHPDGWRQVRAPGGYECWHFSAFDPQSGARLTIGLWLGHPSDPAYAKKFRLYRFWPTRFPPPVPRDYPSVVEEIIVPSHAALRSLTPASASEFEAATDRCDVRLGNVRLAQLDNGAFELSREDSTRLLFRGGAGGETIRNGAHHVIVVARGCVVEGKLTLPTFALAFNGTGIHRHFFGTRYLDDERRLLAGDG